MKSIVIMQPNL